MRPSVKSLTTYNLTCFHPNPSTGQLSDYRMIISVSDTGTLSRKHRDPSERVTRIIFIGASKSLLVLLLLFFSFH